MGFRIKSDDLATLSGHDFGFMSHPQGSPSNFTAVPDSQQSQDIGIVLTLIS